MRLLRRQFGGSVRVKVPLNEPGLVQVRRDENGELRQDDLEQLAAVYRILRRTPRKVLRNRAAAAQKAALR